VKCGNFPFSALTLLVERHERHPDCKKLGVGFVGGDDLTGALYTSYSSVVVTMSIILSSNETSHSRR